MNKIWVIISLFCLIYGLITGRYEDISNSILALPLEGLKLTVTLVFSACFWNGMMMIMYDSGLIDYISLALSPLLNLIMPTLKDETAKKYISSKDISCNLLIAFKPAGVTLIPTTVIAIRQAYGSVNPTDFMIYGIIGTLCSCIAGLILDRIYRCRNIKKNKKL